MLEARNMGTTKPFSRFTGILMGVEGSGKSRLAVTARKPVLVLDWDMRAEALAGLKDVYALTFTDKPWPAQPTACGEGLDILAKLEASRDISTWGIFDVPAGTTIRTIVDDSITVHAKRIMASGLYGSPGIRREINFGSGKGATQVQVPKSFDGWGAEMSAVEEYVLRLLAIKDLDVILTMHESAEEAPDSTQEQPKFTGKVCPFPVRHGRLMKYFNEVWRLKRESGPEPSIQFQPNYQFTSKSGLILDGIKVKPDIEYLINESAKKTNTTK